MEQLGTSIGDLVRQGMERMGLGVSGEDGAPATPLAQAGAAPVMPVQSGQDHVARESVPSSGAGPTTARVYERHALISVHDKEGVVQLAKELHGAMDVQLVSTGGTHRLLAAADLPVTELDVETAFPEVLDGKWGTRCMSNSLHAQVVARRQRLHESEELRRLGLAPMDLVVANLFLFGSTLQPHAAAEESIEDIDVGTPTIIRAAARNYPNVVVLVDPSDYRWVCARLQRGSVAIDSISLDERRRLAYKAYRHVALYDLSVAQFLGGGSGITPEPITTVSDGLSRGLSVSLSVCLSIYLPEAITARGTRSSSVSGLLPGP
jgi:hypothetical protein